MFHLWGLNSPDVARKGLVQRHFVLAVVVIHVPSELFHPSWLFMRRRWTEFRRLFIPWSRLRSDWFGPKRRLLLGGVFYGVVGPWVVLVLGDDSYAYLDTLNTHSFCVFLQFGFVSTRGFAGLFVVVLFRVVFFTTCVLNCCITH